MSRKLVEPDRPEHFPLAGADVAEPNEPWRLLAKKVGDLQGEFEENQLNLELWTSVDLLENIGLQNNLVFAELDRLLENGEADPDKIKDALREGRAKFSTWLYDQFERSAEEDGHAAALEDAFCGLVKRLGSECERLPAQAKVSLEQEHFSAHNDDTALVRLGKAAKRLARSAGRVGFVRVYSPRQVGLYFLTVRLPKRLEGVVQKLGQAELFHLHRLKGLYEEIDRSYNGYLKMIDSDQLTGADRLTELKAELSESFRLAGAEIIQFYAEVNTAFNNCFDEILKQVERAGRKAGTLGEREYRCRRESRALALEGLRRQIAQLGRWRSGFIGYYLMELEIARFQNRLRHAVDESVVQVNSKLGTRLEGQRQAVEGHCRRVFAYLEDGWKGETQPEKQRAGIERCRSELTGLLRDRVQVDLASLGDSAEIGQLIDVVRGRFSELAAATPESFLVVEESFVQDSASIELGPVKLKVAPVQAVVRIYLERELVPRLGEVNESMLGLVRRMGTLVDEFGHVVSFSLGNVAVEMREDGKDPEELVQVAYGRLRRSLKTFNDKAQALVKESALLHRDGVAAVADTARRLKKLVLEERVGEMRQRIERKGDHSVRRWAASRADDVAQVWNSWMAETAAQPESLGEEQGERGDSPAGAGVEGWIDSEQALLQKVPYAYRQLFSTDPLEVSEFLSGRSAALGVIGQALARWRQRAFSPVIIIGDQGSGKTSLINCAMEQTLNDIPLIRHRISQTLTRENELAALLGEILDLPGATLAELEKQVQEVHLRRVVILEDVHRLHLRAWGGLKLLARFLEFVDATGDDILWLLSIDQYAWQYLAHVAAIERHFAFRLETGRLSPTELEGAIMARHRATGYRLSFTGATADDEAGQQRLHRDFFTRLSAACGGNVFAAIFYWLRSIQHVDGETLCVTPLEELHLDFISSLNQEEMLDLAMVVEHGGLSAAHFATVFQLDASEASARLKRLEHIGALRSQGGESYAINPILYHPIVGELKKRHVFY